MARRAGGAAVSALLDILRSTADAARELVSRLAAPSAVTTERLQRGPRPGDVVAYGWWVDPRTGKQRPGHTGILSYVPGWVGVDPPQVIEARRWVGQGDYELATGGRNPHDGTPFDSQGRCDCSGFVCHCLGIDRYDDVLERWWNTTAIVRDGKAPGGRWEPVPLLGVDLRRCKAIHCHGGKGPAVSETSAALWHQRGVVTRLIAA